MRIGLYGGCFNPVHAGHLAAAQGAFNALGLDKVIFIPSGTPPLKGREGLADGAHRLAMLQLAIGSDTRFAVSAIEVERLGPSYTLDTVRTLRGSFPDRAELFFLLGDDCISRLPYWKGIDELHAMLRFAILPRLGQSISSEDVRLIRLRLPERSVSSTEIRTMLAAGEMPPQGLLPQNVARYIQQNALYAPHREHAHV